MRVLRKNCQCSIAALKAKAISHRSRSASKPTPGLEDYFNGQGTDGLAGSGYWHIIHNIDISRCFRFQMSW